jgi:DNA repair protein RadC
LLQKHRLLAGLRCGVSLSVTMTENSTAELLAYLLSNGRVRDPLVVACKLLHTYGVKRLRNAAVAELCSDGLSRSQAQRLSVICELAQRLALVDPDEHPCIVSADNAAAILRPLMLHLDHEEFRVLVLDTKHRVIANVLLYTGTVSSSNLRVAEVFRPAIVRNSPNILVAHNHPSGDPSPSQEDYEVSRQLVEAGRVLDIEVLDHLVIGNPRYTSLKEKMQW